MKKTVKKSICAVLACAMIMTSSDICNISSYGQESMASAAKVTLKLAKKKVNVNVGKKVKVKYSASGKVKAVSSKKKIATASVKKKNILIKGIKDGSAVIKVTCTKKKKTKSAKIKVTVRKNDNKAELNETATTRPSVSPSNPTRNPEEIKKAAEKLGPFASGVNKFGIKVFDGLHEDDKNLFVSPFSIYVALAMLANGALGNTQTEIMNALGITDLSQWNTLISEYIKGSMDEKVKFNVGNSVWLGNRLVKAPGIDNDFINPLKTYYDSEVKPDIDFTSNETVNNVNKWIEDKTDGMLKDMIKELDPTVMALIINTLFFEAGWTEVFYEDATKDEVFHGSSGDKTIKMMNNGNENFGYFKNDKFKGIELLYGAKRAYAMDILMSADDNVSTTKLWNSLTDEEKNNTLTEFSLANSVNIRSLKLPKFSLKYESGDKMKNVLKNIGIKEVFSNGQADLTKIGRGPDGPLYVDDVLHNTALEVTEKGTRAAAATVIIAKATSAMMTSGDPIDFIVDRPFVFTIRDRVSGMVLFVGEVNNLQ